jgi:chemotaxis response regulator CheB
MFSLILFIHVIVFGSCEAKRVDNLADMLELAALEVVGNDQMGEFSNLNRDEAAATILDDQVYTIYEQKRENPKTTVNRVKYRIKSAEDTMPSCRILYFLGRPKNYP